MIKRLCVFCGSSNGKRPEYLSAAKELGTLLAQRNIELVYGGAKVGLMGAVADAALAAGGKVIGVIPHVVMALEVAHSGLSDLRVVKSMHERKQTMADLSDGFIALPGGIGTFEEFCEIVTWAQLGVHAKPCGLLNTAGYYDGFLGFFDHALAEGFLRKATRDLVLVDACAKGLLEQFTRHKASKAPPILNRETT